MRIGTQRGGDVLGCFNEKRGNVYELEFRKLFEGIFFFSEAKRNIYSKFASLYSSSGFREIKAGVERLNEQFGWYLTLKTIAESGIFNRPDMTPLQSAEQADLYEAFTYLAACKAESDYQRKLNETK